MVNRKCGLLICAMLIVFSSGCSEKNTDDVDTSGSGQSIEQNQTDNTNNNSTNNGNNANKEIVTTGERVAEQTEAKAETGSAEQISIGNTYKGSNTEFSIFKIKTDKDLKPTKGNLYYKGEDNQVYIDSMINLTNTGSKDLESKDMNVYFVAPDNTKYEDSLVAIETDRGLGTYEQIAPLSTKLVHFGVKIPDTITTGKVCLSLDGKTYCIDYDVNKEVSNKTEIALNKEIKDDGYGSFKLTKTTYTADVLPPDTSGFYTHYPVDDPSNDIYYVVYCDITNLMTSAVDSDSFVSMTAKYDGKYEYNATMALVQKDKSGFDYSSITDINSLETRIGVFMFEVPKTVQKMSVELEIYFDGKEYCYKE